MKRSTYSTKTIKVEFKTNVLRLRRELGIYVSRGVNIGRSVTVRLVRVESTLLKLRVRTSRQLIWLACMETLLDDVPSKIV